MTRATSSCVASWARRWRITGSSLSGTPSRTVVLTYSTSNSKRWAMGEKVNMVKRSRSKASEMYWNPRLTSPTTNSSGTKTSFRNTSLVRSSPIVQIALTVMFGWSIGTRKSVMPACLAASGSVRAPTQYHSAKWADVVHVFCPFNVQPPSTFVALSCMEAASEPALGSEYPTANSTSLRRILGRNSSFSVSFPCRMIVLPTMPTPLPICGPPRPASCSLRRYS